MASFKVTGGKRLKGEITPQGAKNEALQILCAVVLTAEPVTIHNISTESLRGVANSRKEKAEATDKMFRVMVDHMRDAMNLDRFKEHNNKQENPKWL